MTPQETSSPAPASTATPTSSVSEEALERIVEYAWHRFNSLDARSGELKKRYLRIREAIIYLTLLITLLAVLSAFTDFNEFFALLLFGLPAMTVGFVVLTAPYHETNRRGIWLYSTSIARNVAERRRAILVLVGLFLVAVLLTWLLQNLTQNQPAVKDLTFRALLVVLPLLSTGLLAFASRFESGIAYVGFRITAEAIRRKIYTLRVLRRLRPLVQTDLEDLLKAIQTERARLDEMGIVTPLWSELYDPHGERVKPNYVDAPTEDDGYTPMTLENYVHWRLIPQTNWYRRSVKRDYQRARILRGWLLFVSALGAFLAAFGLGEFVAVTVAGVTALRAWISLNQYEQNYNMQARATLKLEDALANYYITLRRIEQKDTKTEQDLVDISTFVETVEGIFDEERDLWRLSVLQGQEATEDALAQLVSTAAPRGVEFEELLAEAEGEEEGEGEAEAEEERRPRRARRRQPAAEEEAPEAAGN